MIGLAAAAVLLLSIGLLCARQIDTAVYLCALQALFAAATLYPSTAPIAILAAALNGVVLPLAIARMGSATILTVRGGITLSWAAAFALLVAACTIFSRAGTDGLTVLGVSVTLLGLLLIVLRTHALAPVLGLLTSQNGLVLVAGAHSDVPLAQAVAAAVPLLPSLVLADNWLRR